jgi:hypothetical protein
VSGRRAGRAAAVVLYAIGDFWANAFKALMPERRRDIA